MGDLLLFLFDEVPSLALRLPIGFDIIAGSMVLLFASKKFADSRNEIFSARD